MTSKARQHEVQAGECLASIGERYGFFVDTLWDHPDNADLRERRENPYVLQPGDIVNIPERSSRTVEAATDARHVFRRRGIPERFRLQLVDDGDPEAHVVYRFEVANMVVTGETDDEGWVEAWIPPGAKQARLIVDPDGDDERELILDLGHLDPPDTEAGVRTRLTNLGYLASEDAAAEAVVLALCAFQFDAKVEVNGMVDDPTCEALLDAHGS